MRPPNSSSPPDLAAKGHFHRLLLLAHTPLWLSAVAVVVLTSSLQNWTTNAHYLSFSLFAASPPLLLPFLFPSRPAASDNHPTGRRRFQSSYALKFNVYIAVLVFFGTYFGTAYFFQLMSMRYTFPAHLVTLDSDILRRQEMQQVPVFLYPLTHAYFCTYYALLLVLYDYVNPKAFWSRSVTVLGLSYVLAWAETWFMASDLMNEWFAYGDRSRMLRVGSWGYASYFVVGLPMLRRLSGEWGWERVVIEAGGCCMGIMVLLEVWGRLVGPI
ncbi:hypothetical protein QBC40DRAFT_325786 [Triangularia verruculosa]|uniref:Uncharacterized protein n=1 Tax=Triangularia verruculosa TaxID=2587418 RepID=A0AAN6XQR2_9PEZI|nr:hypothetical protein QBC40DRAFT_325786 [Triangularia verruculosa]